MDSEAVKLSSSSVTADALPHAELCAVLDTGPAKRPKTPLPVSGPELAARLKMGTRVVRGVDWKWGDQVRHDTRCCFYVRSRVSLIYRTELTTKKWKTEKLRSKKTDMLKGVGEQSWESMESVLKKKRKASVGRTCRKGRF